MKLFVRGLAAAVLAAVVLGAAAPGPAVADGAGDIKYRKAMMKTIGGHTAAAAIIIKGEVPFTGQLKDHAHAIAELSKMAAKIFPEGSGAAAGRTRALDAIWQKPAEFKKALGDFQTAAANLAQVASSDPKGVDTAFRSLAKACRGCHENFREKK